MPPSKPPSRSTGSGDAVKTKKIEARVLVWRDGVPCLVKFDGTREVSCEPQKSAERALAELLRGVSP